MMRTNLSQLPTLGIIGGGQLALMLAGTAARLGWRTIVLDESGECPASRSVAEVVTGAWSDEVTLAEFASKADLITLENEFVDAAVLARLAGNGAVVEPRPRTMALVQDKLVQKRTLQDAGIDVVPFLPVESAEGLAQAISEFGFPLVLKRRCLGYDGTGNRTLRTAGDVEDAVRALGGFGCGLYAEAWCAFERELAVIVVRTGTGECAVYPLVESRQRDHVCESVIAPAGVPAEVESCALALARKSVEAVRGTGAFGVEMFLMRDGSVLVNELAPRVHNSGHYTIEACVCSQFENHLRAVLGLPLGSTTLRQPAAMVNLLGQGHASGEPSGLASALAVPGAQIHLYGKLRASPRRKMGHVTATAETVDEALALAQAAAESIRFDTPLPP